MRFPDWNEVLEQAASWRSNSKSHNGIGRGFPIASGAGIGGSRSNVWPLAIHQQDMRRNKGTRVPMESRGRRCIPGFRVSCFPTLRVPPVRACKPHSRGGAEIAEQTSQSTNLFRSSFSLLPEPKQAVRYRSKGVKLPGASSGAFDQGGYCSRGR